MTVFRDKTLMITGGTGSFGNAVLHRFLNSEIREIRIFSRDEKKQEEMRISLNNSKLKFYIGDVRNYDAVCQATKGVDFVFHAAALKQVPLCEFYPMEAMLTNFMGAEHMGINRFGVKSDDYNVVIGFELDPFVWHTVIALERGSILLEIKRGPFEPHNSKELAPWAPKKDSPESSKYLLELFCLEQHCQKF